MSAEDLRQYAIEKEEAMKARVEAYRLEKEDELKRILERKFLELELKELAVKRIREGGPDLIESIKAEFDALIDRLQDKKSSIPKPKRIETPSPLVDTVKERVKEIVEKSRYLRECAILEKNEKLKTLMAEIQETPFDQKALLFTMNETILDKVNELDSKIRTTVKTQTEIDEKARKELYENVRIMMNKKIDSAISAINFDVEKFHAIMSEIPAYGDEEFLLTYRRRILIAIEKRMHDIILGYEEKKRSQIQEVVDEYRAELERVFIQYIKAVASKHLASKPPNLMAPKESVIKEAWDNHNVPRKDRIKFIQLVTERAQDDPKLFHYINKYISSS